jgi:hypothetical protein
MDFPGMAPTGCRFFRLRLFSTKTDGESYGVAVALEGGESSSVRNVTLSQREILRLVGALVRGRVTPASLQDVVEDWLLR